MTMDGFGLRDNRLREIYAGSSGPVAFLDESYRAPGNRGRDFNERPFYTIAAVVVDREQAATIRSAFTDIPGSLFWHTTEFNRDPVGQQYIREMLDYLAASDMFTVITVQTEIKIGDDNLMSYARAECLTTLATELTRGHGENAVRLMVMDSRDRVIPGANKTDKDTIHRLRSAGIINENVQIQHSGPGREPLLWAPDVAGWSYRRELAVGDSKWFSQIRDVAVQLHVHGADVSLKRNSPHMPQQNPGALSASSESQRLVVSGSSLTHQGQQSEELAAVRRAAAQQRPSFSNALARAVGAGGQAHVEQLQRQVKASPSSDGQQKAIKDLDKILNALTPAPKNRRADSADNRPDIKPDQATRSRTR
ncbi:hypothetical protein ACSBOX_21490 (plasmid) [Arthrobacter sp. KN11-1C]|uniref:hypothetical protein n=1 Tax=Arthrobacter sp. KN11-1C TaxID=3445774 RepID=UPI003FA0438A